MFTRARSLVCAGALFLPLLSAAAEEGAKALSQEERIARLERLMEGRGLVEILTRLDDLQQELQRLRGKSEVQTHELGELRNSLRSAHQDFDNRLRALESHLASGGMPSAPEAPLSPPADSLPVAAGTPDAAPASPATPPAAPPADAAQEQATYQQAFTLLKEARYEKAITAFQDYLARFPAGANADNAQYWLGEAHYVTRNFKQALQAFQTIVDKSASSPKRPDAMLKTGFVHYELGKWDAARKSLNEVIQTYPNTSVAKLADNRLQRMKKEGH